MFLGDSFEVNAKMVKFLTYVVIFSNYFGVFPRYDFTICLFSHSKIKNQNQQRIHNVN